MPTVAIGHDAHLMVCFWCAAPALVGNVVIWKPSPMAVYANYLTHKILLEAGLPPSVIQFVPGPAPDIVKQAIDHRDFAGLHFTGSTLVFKRLWKDIANNLDKYKGYPRIVGETGTSTALVVMVLILCLKLCRPRGKEFPSHSCIGRRAQRGPTIDPVGIRIPRAKVFRAVTSICPLFALEYGFQRTVDYRDQGNSDGPTRRVPKFLRSSNVGVHLSGRDEARIF